MNKNRIIDGCLIQPQTSLKKPEVKTQFLLFEDPDGESRWYDFVINGKKFTIQGAKVNFKDWRNFYFKSWSDENDKIFWNYCANFTTRKI